jgi:hypothetical protein
MTPDVARRLKYKQQKLPHWFASRFSQKHAELQAFLDDAPPGSVSLVCAPRMHGKTSFVLAEAIRLALAGHEKYVVLASQDRLRARDMLRNIRAALESKTLAGKIQRKRPWGDYELNFNRGARGERGEEKEKDFKFSALSASSAVKFRALSIRQNWRGLLSDGARPSLVVIDDMERLETVRNPRIVKERINFILREARPCLERGGRIFILGNLFSNRAAFTALFRQVECYPAIRRFRFDAEDSEGNPVWPEHFSKETLLELKEQMGKAAYEAEFLNMPSDEGRLVNPDDIRYYEAAEIAGELEKMEVVGFYDPSATGTESSDCQAVVAVGKIAREGK